MGRSKRSALPARVREVRHRIDHWRKTRKKRSPMPEDLWESAVALARVHGVYSMSQALRVSYESLRSRVGDAPRKASGRGSGSAGFIELDPAQLVGGAEPRGTEVELVDKEGAKMIVRLAGGGDLDVLALAGAFWRRGT